LQTQDAVPPGDLVVTSLFSSKVLVDSIVVCRIVHQLTFLS